MTGLLQFVDGFLQLADSLMGIDAIGYILCSMPENLFDGKFVGTSVVQPGRAGVPAFVWFMFAPGNRHNFFEQLQESMIRDRLAIHCDQCAAGLCHPVFIVAEHFPVDRNKPVFTGGGFGVTDPEDPGM